jgi:hypothetical protein
MVNDCDLLVDAGAGLGAATGGSGGSITAWMM